jgi:hypothetical protein
MNPATLDKNQNRLLGSLTLATVRWPGGDTVCVNADNRFRAWGTTVSHPQ